MPPPITPIAKETPVVTPPSIETGTNIKKETSPSTSDAKAGQKLKALESGKLKKTIPPKKIKEPSTQKALSKIKIKPNGARILTLATYSIYEISKAFKKDREEGNFYHTPKALLSEGFGWSAATLATTVTLPLTKGNSKMTELIGLGAYSVGANIGEHFIDDYINIFAPQFHSELSWDYFKKNLGGGITYGLIGPFVGPYVYGRLSEL